MAVVAAIVAVPLTLILRGGDDDRGGGAERDAAGIVALERVPSLDIALRVPRDWERKRRKGTLALRSANGNVLIALAAPGPADDVADIQREAVATIEREYRRVSVADTSRGVIGGRRARSAVLSAEHPKTGESLQVLVATAKGREKAYLVEVYASGDPQGLLQGQAVLNNLELNG